MCYALGVCSPPPTATLASCDSPTISFCTTPCLPVRIHAHERVDALRYHCHRHPHPTSSQTPSITDSSNTEKEITDSAGERRTTKEKGEGQRQRHHHRGPRELRRVRRQRDHASVSVSLPRPFLCVLCGLRLRGGFTVLRFLPHLATALLVRGRPSRGHKRRRGGKGNTEAFPARVAFRLWFGRDFAHARTGGVTWR